jgi:hypothetical protein
VGIFFGALSLLVRPSVFGFFIFDRISDEQGNYRRSKFRQTNSAGEAAGKIFTDELCAYTDGMILSVKLFNGVMIHLIS